MRRGNKILDARRRLRATADNRCSIEIGCRFTFNTGAIGCSRLALTRLVPVSYFRNCANAIPIMSASFCCGCQAPDAAPAFARRRVDQPVLAFWCLPPPSLRTWLFLIALALSAGSAAIADALSNGTKQEREACAPEAMKFCNRELDVNGSALICQSSSQLRPFG